MNIRMKNRVTNSKQNVLMFGLLFFFNVHILAQDFGTLRGFVMDADGEPMIGANIRVLQANTDILETGAITDENGIFILEKLKTGAYTLQISYVGFQNKTQNVTIGAGKVISLKIIMDELNKSIGVPIEIWSPKFSPVLTSKEIYEAPAVYDDPGRTASLLAGVNVVDDGTNIISVRGNNPNSLKWYLEGIEIPNPNHTPNAGTSSDRITTSGGGVNMIKPQFFQSTAFYNGAFNTGLGNATGGILDMRINKEMPKRNQHSIQIGLIGLEALSKGAINREKGSFYNASVRYSTVGLLANGFGLDFGGEKISFIDANLSVFFPTKKYGNFTLFNISGLSSNIFRTQRDTANWEVQKDRFDIDFYSATNITGVSHQFSKNQHYFETTVAYSIWNAVRKGNRLDDNFNATLTQQDSLQHRRFSFRTKYRYYNFSAELNASQLNYQLYNFDSTANFRANGTQNGWLIQPSLGYLLFKNSNYYLRFGLHSMIYTENGSYSVEPRVTYIKNLPGRRGDLTLSYGLHSQLQAPEVYLSANNLGERINQNLDFTRSHHLNLKYLKESRYGKYAFQIQGYYQYLFDIPIANAADRSFSVINDLNSFITDTLANEGVGQNYGLELSYRKNFDQNFYISTNLTLYQSKYKGGDGEWRNTRYNGNTIANIFVGKDWIKRRINDKNRVILRKIGMYGRAVYAGGFRTTPIDLTASQQAGRTLYLENQAFTDQQPDVFRLDVRFYWKKEIFSDKMPNSPFRTHTFALDIQNITNQQNVAFNYFDALARRSDY